MLKLIFMFYFLATNFSIYGISSIALDIQNIEASYNRTTALNASPLGSCLEIDSAFTEPGFWPKSIQSSTDYPPSQCPEGFYSKEVLTNYRTELYCSDFVYCRQFHDFYSAPVRQAIEQLQKDAILWFGDSIVDILDGTGNSSPIPDYIHLNNALGNSIVNLGLATDNIAGVKYRWNFLKNDSKLLGHEKGQLKPKIIILSIGTNDLKDVTSSRSVVEVVEGIFALADEFRITFPRAKILLVGILPRFANFYSEADEALASKKAKLVNQELKRRSLDQNSCDPGIYFFELWQELLLNENFDTGNYLNSSLFSDGLHPNNNGYEIYIARIKEKIIAMQAPCEGKQLAWSGSYSSSNPISESESLSVNSYKSKSRSASLIYALSASLSSSVSKSLSSRMTPTNRSSISINNFQRTGELQSKDEDLPSAVLNNAYLPRICKIITTAIAILTFYSQSKY